MGTCCCLALRLLGMMLHALSCLVCSGQGLTAEEYAQLKQDLAAAEHGLLLLPFMEPAPSPAAASGQPAAKLHAQPANAQLLYCLGSCAPVCAYLRRDVRDAVQDLSLVSPSWRAMWPCLHLALLTTAGHCPAEPYGLPFNVKAMADHVAGL